MSLIFFLNVTNFYFGNLTCLYIPWKTLVIWATSWQNQQSECAPSEDSDQPEHPPSLIRVFAVCMKKAGVLRYPLSAQRRLWSAWADVQADLSLRWAHTDFVGFVTRRLIYHLKTFIWKYKKLLKYKVNQSSECTVMCRFWTSLLLFCRWVK